VSSSTPAFQRARRPEHKRERYDSILAAAREFGRRRGVRAVTLTDIAAGAGVHKSAVLRYFETREQVYLHLTAEGWQDWARAVHAEFDGTSEGSAQILAAALSATLSERPLFCDLLAHAPLNLERHVSVNAVREFKLTALAAVDELAALAARVVPQLTCDNGRDLITAVTALAGSLWQIANPPDQLAELYAQEPQLAHAAVEFPRKLDRLTLVVTLGLLNAPDDARTTSPTAGQEASALSAAGSFRRS
jgi:AcrR family transcriptional regulator